MALNEKLENKEGTEGVMLRNLKTNDRLNINKLTQDRNEENLHRLNADELFRSNEVNRLSEVDINNRSNEEETNRSNEETGLSKEENVNPSNETVNLTNETAVNRFSEVDINNRSNEEKVNKSNEEVNLIREENINVTNVVEEVNRSNEELISSNGGNVSNFNKEVTRSKEEEGVQSMEEDLSGPNEEVVNRPIEEEVVVPPSTINATQSSSSGAQQSAIAPAKAEGSTDNNLEERNADLLNDSVDSEKSDENPFRRYMFYSFGNSAADRMENADEENSSDDDEFDVGTDCDMWFVENSSSDSPERSETPTTEVAASLVKSLLAKPKPPHNWFVLKELRRRELGLNGSPQRFTGKFYSSLHAVERLELMYKLQEHTGCVNAINFNRAGTRLVSASDDKQAVVWDWATGKCLQAFNTGHESNVFQAKFLSLIGEEHIVTCSRDGQVRLALQNGAGTYENTIKLAQHTKACHKLSLLPHSPHVILSAGEDSTVFSIDIREKKATRLMHVKHDDKKLRLYSIHANPMTSNEFVIGGEDTYIRIYDRRNIKRNGIAPIQFKPAQVTKPYSVYVTCAVFNYNGTEVLGSYNDDDIYLFDAKATSDAVPLHKYEGHRNSQTVKGVNFFGPRSEFVISGSDCGYIYIWDKKTESIVQWMRGDEDGVINCLEPHPWIPVLATSGLDSDIKIWIPSCEHEPKMEGLDEVLLKNIRSKETRRHLGAYKDPFNEVLILGRWMRHLRYLEQTRRADSDD